MVTSPWSNRKYTGNSLIEFDSGIKLDCEYVLDLSESNGGNMVIHCNVPVPTKFQKLEKVIKLLVRQLDENNELNFASINGNTTKPDGKIFEKCILDHTHVNIRPKGNNSQISCPQIDLKDVEPQVLGLLNKLAKGFNVDVTNLSENITGEITLDFIVDSNVKIIFHELSQDEFVSSIYGLTNFQFGPVEYTPNNLSQPCEFEIRVEQTKIHFIRIHNYSDVLSRR